MSGIGPISRPAGIAWGSHIGPISGADYRAAMMSLRPRGYWRFVEPSGSVCVDEMGNPSGLYVGYPTLGVPGLLVGAADTAATFAAAASQSMRTANEANHANYFHFGDVFSYVFWLKTSAAGGPLTVTSIGSGEPTIRIIDGFVILRQATIGDLFTAGDGAAAYRVNDGARHFVAVTKNGAVARCYIDGLLIPTTVANRTFGTTTAQLIWGSYQDSLYWLTGTLAQGGIFDRDLTPVEVAMLNRVGRGVFS